ncbi:hypothetical protein [Clostridium sp. Cult2]|uniref:hypothetical protein n=1 Tax=Clostridium sp. Cult2 TaxID=2079003 RepID=UPI001F36A4F8|nr:hypothetical protein [Clostridium sp. Cult2]MCF6464825.1 hypothetical protein [Clostridium sp. Cult2]
MLDNKGFDLWADDYDKSVQLSEEGNEYPFAGYKDVLGTIYNIVHRKEKAKVLDIGDIAFETRGLLEQCKAKYDNYWDDEEVYLVFDELKEFFPKEDIIFTTISHCAGIIQLRKLS